MTASVAGSAIAILTLSSSQMLRADASAFFPLGGFHVALDDLGAVFLLAISLVGVAASVYAIGYTDSHDMNNKITQACYPLFLLSMMLVTAASGLVTFLFAWELMAITSLLLVLTSYTKENTRLAGIWYAGMTHFSFLLILVGFALLQHNGIVGTFDDARQAAQQLDPAMRSAIFLVTFLGFATKAGAVPFHVWLPRAHAEAPSHISALMSGAMVKLGIYGMLRMTWDVLGGGPRWWFLLLLGVGIISATYGILHAATSKDLKRLLAYSTSENIGLILIGIGACGLYLDAKMPVLAAFALTAALLHVINHSLFKGLLFLCAGSVFHAAHTRNLNELGGMGKRLPYTMAAFAVGAAAIIALPPLNGFASEWMLLQSLFRGIPAASTVMSAAIPLAVAAIALAGGLVAATFVKAFGMTFLAMPRSETAAQAREVHGTMRAGQLVLALGCVVFGIGATYIIEPLAKTAFHILPHAGAPEAFANRSYFHVPGSPTRMSQMVIALALLGITFLLFFVLRLTRASRARRTAPTWGCGRTLHTPRMEYTATSFAEPLQRIFDDILRPSADLNIDKRTESRYYVEAIRFQSHIDDICERRIYLPMLGFARWLGKAGRHIQNGSVHRYVSYMLFAFLIALLVTQ